MARHSDFRRELAAMERRMQAMERHLDGFSGAVTRAATRGSAGVAQATDRVGDALMSALTDIVDRFRGGARVAGGEAARVGHDAARYGQDVAVRFGHEAARLGGDAVRRVAGEVERRPLAMLAVAAGIGLLIGIVGRRH